jgi:hypothetical protein
MTVETMPVRDHGVGDSRLMGPISGVLWLTAGIAAAVVQLLPGTPREHPELAWMPIAFIVAYGLACVRGWIDWDGRSLRHHAVAIVLFRPLIALGLWVSGGVDSYLGPTLVLPTLYVPYFVPRGWCGRWRSSRSRRTSHHFCTRTRVRSTCSSAGP